MLEHLCKCLGLNCLWAFALQLLRTYPSESSAETIAYCLNIDRENHPCKYFSACARRSSSHYSISFTFSCPYFDSLLRNLCQSFAWWAVWIETSFLIGCNGSNWRDLFYWLKNYSCLFDLHCEVLDTQDSTESVFNHLCPQAKPIEFVESSISPWAMDQGLSWRMILRSSGRMILRSSGKMILRAFGQAHSHLNYSQSLSSCCCLRNSLPFYCPASHCGIDQTLSWSLLDVSCSYPKSHLHLHFAFSVTSQP